MNYAFVLRVFQYLVVNSKYVSRLLNIKGCTYMEIFWKILLLYFEASIFSSITFFWYTTRQWNPKDQGAEGNLYLIFPLPFLCLYKVDHNLGAALILKWVAVITCDEVLGAALVKPGQNITLLIAWATRIKITR